MLDNNNESCRFCIRHVSQCGRILIKFFWPVYHLSGSWFFFIKLIILAKNAGHFLEQHNSIDFIGILIYMNDFCLYRFGFEVVLLVILSG